MGCTLIRRDVVTKMLEAMPEIVDTRLHLHPAGETIKNAGSNRIIRAFEKLDIPERGVVSEDLSFCIRWNRLGGKVWAAIGYRISHVGPYDYAGRYLDVVEQQHAAAVAAQVQPSDAPMSAQEVASIPSSMGGSTVAEPLTTVASAPAPVSEVDQAPAPAL